MAVEILVIIMRKGSLENLTLTEHTKVKRCRGRQRVNYFTTKDKDEWEKGRTLI